jgi:ADP-heptose:LPS heptosyltransferase
LNGRNLLAPLRRLGRLFLLGMLRLFPRKAGSAPLRPAEVRSILVIRTDDRLGNLLLTTPLLGAIRRHFPSARLGMLCASRRAVAIEGTGLYDDLWRFEKRDLFRRPWRFFALLSSLRRARYQVTIDAGHFHAFSFTASALTLLSGAPARIGHRRGDAERVFTHPVDPPAERRYDAAVKLDLLGPLGVVDPECPPLRTSLGATRAAEFAALMGDRALLVNAGGRKGDHRVSGELLAEAAATLGARLGLKAFVVYGPGERELAERTSGRGATLLPPTDLEGLAAAMRASRLVLTSDSGPLHLAVAVGAPTVAIFRKADSARWARPSSALVAVDIGSLDPPVAVGRVVEGALRLASPVR